ncbi:MAG: DUF4388 domain-containing protein [Stenotrophomonas sp.]|uniref:DUF4388 domain-containing protein n=1 Tax=Stenotrophomonas sp. TaxID=69392 RepID=UPI003D6D55AF
MAIHGSLGDFSLGDILKVIRGKRGILTVDAQDGQVLRVHVSESSVTHLSLERSVGTQIEAHRILQVFGQGSGQFQFETSDVDTTQNLRLQLSDVVGALAATVVRERDLPHAKTLFLLIKGRQVQLPDELAQFLAAAEGQLAAGASAEQLSETLGIPLNAVRTQLQRLREVKKVWPMQAHVEQLGADEREQRRSMGRRILDLFSK